MSRAWKQFVLGLASCVGSSFSMHVEEKLRDTDRTIFLKKVDGNQVQSETFADSHGKARKLRVSNRKCDYESY